MAVFLNSITSQANFTVFQISFQVIKIEKARFQLKKVFKNIETTIYIFNHD